MMDKYEILMTTDAADDLIELRDYIADVLLAPDTALAYIRTVREKIGTLSVLPERNKCVDEEPWRSRGIRKMMVKNFIVYYRIETSAKQIYILNIIYAKRDQLRMLARMKNG